MITIKNLSFSYTKGTNLLTDINLNIPRGIYLSILGENGSCKSTLVKLILGLLKPDNGTITLGSNKISYVPQRMDNFNADFPITIKELLSCHAKTIGLKNPKCITDSLEKVNMLEFSKSLIGNLSGGQQQRIFIARALMGDPDLIILDEPSTGVDEKSQSEIYPLLQSLNKNFGKTIISVEHNTRIALKYSTHILKVENANIKLYSKEEFLNTIDDDCSFSKII
ncbi:zinc transport system ATP-binding protein [Clostridium saccharoperbutylacetonicum]|uniref:ABC-type Mn/Zn transport system, ATPase component n=1 Tax=Clostridium saccharoperbutylacetonicum N1-4(HMT) TaxID=931276 RepID=M1MQA7_9CLOT|nr:metal ABC transporter ATP-binding protein [Clostridium saccharoperbutylacetonicum]AGF58368.1 ABC-type Mn/Zn transport system, ATPase component [Clostridium saccharoperbutylacetonicum N1-4(HMT)]NRT60854.1 zinc transport system ATP-binding protein [Clostridium saccharoperbutylacetonicum]NSB24168.1 zinc transport system ATP-binding protein [Clostridium saccharoperbutylacetonicum]NSB43546.1 zinc transport system ATP-binding protein [Clostridium saccharoperbutylacetonicum]